MGASPLHITITGITGITTLPGIKMDWELPST